MKTYQVNTVIEAQIAMVILCCELRQEIKDKPLTIFQGLPDGRKITARNIPGKDITLVPHPLLHSDMQIAGKYQCPACATSIVRNNKCGICGIHVDQFVLTEDMAKR